QKYRDDPHLKALLLEDGVEVLDTLIGQCATAAAHWDQVTRFCDRVPRTVVHGDFAPRNLRVGDDRGRAALRAFDWEDAAWAPPALDLIQADPQATCDSANPDMTEYLAAVRASWPELDRNDLRRLGEIGRVFWHALAIRLDADALSPDWLEA